MDHRTYHINLELVQVIPEKIRNTMFAAGRNSMEQVGHEDWNVTKEINIFLKERDLAAISLIELIEETYPDLSQIDYGIVILGVGSNTSYKNFIKDIDLQGCIYFKTLPVGFTAGQVLIQESKSFVSVANNVKIKELTINECNKFTSIGSNCTIERLFIGYSCDNFTTLPSDIKADLVDIMYKNVFKKTLVDKYKTKTKVLKALKIMYPNVKEFWIGDF